MNRQRQVTTFIWHNKKAKINILLVLKEIGLVSPKFKLCYQENLDCRMDSITIGLSCLN